MTGRTSRTIAIVTVVAALSASASASAVAAAPSGAGKAVAAVKKRSGKIQRATRLPAGPSGGVVLGSADAQAVARYQGHPNGTAPGSATGAECRALAAAANGIVDQIEQGVLDGTEVPYDANGVIEGILDAGVARGCVFMTG